MSLDKFLGKKTVGYVLLILVVLLLIYSFVSNANCKTFLDLPTCNPDGLLTPGENGNVVCPSEPFASESKDAEHFGYAIIDKDSNMCDYIIDKEIKILCKDFTYSREQYAQDMDLFSRGIVELDVSLCEEIVDISKESICKSRIAELVN